MFDCHYKANNTFTFSYEIIFLYYISQSMHLSVTSSVMGLCCQGTQGVFGRVAVEVKLC